MPRAGRMAPEVSRPDIREVLVRNYRIVYLVGKNEITILTVYEGHRLLRP
jgi:plasmid stabilization system protein ParE